MQKRALIVDDEKPLARALELKLTHEGFEAQVVHNGVDAIKSLKAEKFDIVLLDLIMPEEDGFEVLKAMKSLKINIPIIISSNLSQEEDIERAKLLGAVDYFVKSDTTLAEIVDKIKVYLV